MGRASVFLGSIRLSARGRDRGGVVALDDILEHRVCRDRVLPRRALGVESSSGWNILARISKGARHPNKFVQKFVHASGVSRIGNVARSGIEKPPRGTELNVRENRDKS